MVALSIGLTFLSILPYSAYSVSSQEARAALVLFFHWGIPFLVYHLVRKKALVFDMKNVRVLIFGLSMIWLVVGILLTPTVKDIMLDFGYFVRSSICWDVWCYVFFFIILALTVAVAFAGRAKGVFNRFVASFSLVFHSFPVLAWFLEPALYIMVFPVGIFALLCSPLNPLFVFPPTRWLLEKVILSHGSWHVPILWLLSMCLFTLGLVVFTVAFVQLVIRKGLLTSGSYSIVRHPQYLGIILATLGFTFLQMNVKLMSFISWLILVFAYVWLARREEASLQEKYGEEFLAYKRRVPFILPLPTKRHRKQE